MPGESFQTSYKCRLGKPTSLFLLNSTFAAVCITAVFIIIFPLSCDCKSPIPTWIRDGRQVTRNHKPRLNDSCDYSMYQDLMDNLKKGKTYDALIGKIWKGHPTMPTARDPKDLCIETDSQGNIDMNEFDCLLNKWNSIQLTGHCGCGSRWSVIDLNYAESKQGLQRSSYSYEYKALKGLNKMLNMEKDGNKLECVASRFGHCTLDGYKKKAGWIVTKCAKNYKCRNVTVWNPISKRSLYNEKTNEWWGVCISESTPDSFRSPFGGGISGKINRMPIIHLFSLIIVAVYWRTFRSQVNFDFVRRNQSDKPSCLSYPLSQN